MGTDKRRANYIAHSPTDDNGVAEDCLYLLSLAEAEKMSDGIRANDTDWWLRTRGYVYKLVRYVTRGGNLKTLGSEVHNSLWVRPALRISVKSPIFNERNSQFQTAPTGGKADVKVGDGFTLADYDGSNGWKLTKTDNSLPVPNTSILSIFGYTATMYGNVTVKYSGAATGENTYLSALLYDKSGNLINDAKVADTSASGSGEVKLSFKNVSPSGWYRAAFVSEHVNGDGETDYFSAPSKMYTIYVGENKESGGQNDGVMTDTALLLPESELPEQLKIKDVIMQDKPLLVPEVEQITGVSGLKNADIKTALDINVKQSGGAEDKQTAKFRVLLKDKIERDKTKQLAVLIEEKKEIKTAPVIEPAIIVQPDANKTYVVEPVAIVDEAVLNGRANTEAAAIGETTFKGNTASPRGAIMNGETSEQTRYTAFKAEYEEDGEGGIISFSVPEYGKYLPIGMQRVIVAELNEAAKFDGEEEKKSLSDGCNAGFGALALLTLAGLTLMRKRNE